MKAVKVLCSLLFTFICLWGNIVPVVTSTAVLSINAYATEVELPDQSESDQREGEMTEEVCLEDALPVAESAWFILNKKPAIPQLLAVGAFSDRSVETPPPKI